jgi:hypothetical protein
LPDTEKRRRLQARLSFEPDRTDFGVLLPATRRALDSVDPMAMLAEAFLDERILLVAGSPVALMRGAVAAFTSLEVLKDWRADARPVVKSGQDAALLAVALGYPRLLVDAKWVLPRPAIEALAAGDLWLPPWKDRDFLVEVGENVKIIPSTEPLVIEVYAKTRRGAEAEIKRLSRLPRLGTIAENVEFRPRQREDA